MVEVATIQSPAEDESSRGIFSLIKKLNVVPDMKKKAKASSFFNMQLSGGKSNNSSKAHVYSQNARAEGINTLQRRSINLMRQNLQFSANHLYGHGKQKGMENFVYRPMPLFLYLHQYVCKSLFL